MKLVSVIVPVYNAQATIDRCVQSIRTQTHTNIEIILVDDGSTDGSAAILDTLAGKDERIRVIHTRNSGVSAARNTGIESARGEYIGFVDADDWIDADMYRHMCGLLEKEKADVAICGYYREFPDTGKTEHDPVSTPGILTNDAAYAQALLPQGFRGYLFNKLFKAVFFFQDGHHIRLDETLYICEDLLCVCQVFCHAQRVVYDPTPLYHYVFLNNSASNSAYSVRKATLVDACRKIADLTKRTFPELARQAENTYLTNIAYIFILARHAKSDFVVPQTDIKRVRRHLFRYIFTSGTPFSYRCLIMVLAINQRFAKALWRFFKGKAID